jgi:Uma2 family endonuclease
VEVVARGVVRAFKGGAAASRKTDGTMIESPPPVTMDIFLAQLAASESRLEFLAGEVVAMSGGTAAHSLLTVRVTVALAGVVTPPCTVFNGDMAVRFADTAYVFPDVSVSCEPVTADDTSLRAPLLVIEVLSQSTATRDRLLKREHYQSLRSLHEYVLIDSRKRRITRFRRDGDRWTEDAFTNAHAACDLTSVGLTLDLGPLYAGIPLADEADEADEIA